MEGVVEEQSDIESEKPGAGGSHSAIFTPILGAERL